MFEGEALGLGAMYETRTIRVPRPFKVGRLYYFFIVPFIDYNYLICLSLQSSHGKII